MPAINTNNQITKLDYPTKNLHENVIIKQQSSKEELGSASLERDVCSRGNNAVTKEPPKLDKELIVGLQEETVKKTSSSITNTRSGSSIIVHLLKPFEYTKNSNNDGTDNRDDMFKRILAMLERDRKVSNLLPWDYSEINYRDRKAIFYNYDESGKKYGRSIEIIEDENTITERDYYFVKGEFVKPDRKCEIWEIENDKIFVEDSYLDGRKIERYISRSELEYAVKEALARAKEAATEKENPIVNSSYFLDEYLKQKNAANKFAADQLIDKKLQSVLKFV